MVKKFLFNVMVSLLVIFLLAIFIFSFLRSSLPHDENITTKFKDLTQKCYDIDSSISKISLKSPAIESCIFIDVYLNNYESRTKFDDIVLCMKKYYQKMII